MNRLFLGLLALAVVVAVATRAFADGDDLALGGDYSKEQIATAGKHCVHGYWVNDRTNLFFAGDTAQLNRDLLKYVAWPCSKRKLVIHVGTKRAKSPWNTKEPNIFADWSANTWKPPADATQPVHPVQLARMEMYIDIWLGSKIKLEDLRIPEGFEVVSGGEIEKFIQKRKQESK